MFDGKTKTALISVFHKEGIDKFARDLLDLGFSIYASGGTAKYLKEEKIPVKDITELVGEPILGHRVVTLSREIHAGILARDISEDLKELERIGVPKIDLVCVDLYPLEEEIAKKDKTRESVIEKTDVGGPTLIHSAAKGEKIVVCDPADREKVIGWLKIGEPNDFKEALCAKGEFTVSKYTAASAEFRSKGEYDAFFGKRHAVCKYGENASQAPAGLFSSESNDPLSLDKFSIIEGTPPSYNNWCDIDRMLQTITHIAAAFEANQKKIPFIALGVKHGNTCGAAVGENARDVLKRMMDGDPLSIFGGLIIANFEIDKDLAGELAGKMLDGIVAPAVSSEATQILRRKGDKCRFVVNQGLKNLGLKSLDSASRFRYVRGGFLKQPNYTFILDLKNQEVKKYGAELSEKQINDILLAWAICSTSNSNTITLVKGGQLLGNGVGQQDRVGAAELAIKRTGRSGHDISGATAASDSFFPFPDAPKILIDAGVKVILSTSGSIRDKETIKLSEQRKISLLMIPDSLARGFFGH